MICEYCKSDVTGLTRKVNNKLVCISCYVCHIDNCFACGQEYLKDDELSFPFCEKCYKKLMAQEDYISVVTIKREEHN